MRVEFALYQRDGEGWVTAGGKVPTTYFHMHNYIFLWRTPKRRCRKSQPVFHLMKFDKVFSLTLYDSAWQIDANFFILCVCGWRGLTMVCSNLSWPSRAGALWATICVMMVVAASMCFPSTYKGQQRVNTRWFGAHKDTYFQSNIFGGCIYSKWGFGVLVDKKNVLGGFFIQV